MNNLSGSKPFARVRLVLLAAVISYSSCPRAHDQSGTPLGLPPLAAVAATDNQVALGKKLFFDKRLSKDGTISCSTCHDPARAFTDGRSLAVGIKDRKGTRNTPSILNVAYESDQFWDGRIQGLELQARAPLMNPSEHGLDESGLLSIISKDSNYKASFKEAFKAEPLEVGQVTAAIAAFERTQFAGNSAFDRHLYGADRSAMSDSAIRGLELFRGRAQCSSCHLIGDHSALLTDHQFHASTTSLPPEVTKDLSSLAQRIVGLRNAGDILGIDRAITQDNRVAALGRFVVTSNPADIGKFKTPSLRNVAMTAPYMHDGSVETLEKAVDVELYVRGAAATYPIVLTVDERNDLVAFLRALTSPK